jgi:hypothetical protein
LRALIFMAWLLGGPNSKRGNLPAVLYRKREVLMERRNKPIAIVQGASSAEIQQLLSAFVDRNKRVLRIAGLIEGTAGEGAACGAGQLRSVGSDGSFALFQELGPGSVSCSLDSSGVVQASEQVCSDIARGCDLVVLSKFGKLEAENRSGLIAAFVSAMEAGLPILTSVSPKHMAAWSAFAAPFFVTLPPEMAALEAWQATASDYSNCHEAAP